MWITFPSPYRWTGLVHHFLTVQAYGEVWSFPWSSIFYSTFYLVPSWLFALRATLSLCEWWARNVKVVSLRHWCMWWKWMEGNESVLFLEVKWNFCMVPFSTQFASLLIVKIMFLRGLVEHNVGLRFHGPIFNMIHELSVFCIMGLVELNSQVQMWDKYIQRSRKMHYPAVLGS